MSDDETPDRAARGTKMIFRRARPDGTEYDGWYVRWTDGFGKRHLAFGGRTKTAAEAFLRKKHDERDRVRIRGERPIELQSLEDFLPTLEAHWRATTEPATVNSRLGFIRKTAKHFGRKPMAHISQADLVAWLTELRTEKNLMPSTLRACSISLSAAFAHAVDLGRAHANPVLGIRGKLPKPHEKPIPRLTPDEIERIYAAMPLGVRACVIVIGESGLRRGEALRLQWHDVEETGDDIRLSVRETKTHKPRIVKLTPRGVQVIRELRDNRPATPLREVPRLFQFGAPHLNREFRAAADRAGFPQVTPHTLRHAVGTQMAEANVPSRDIRDFLGHASIRTTERYMNRAPQSAIDRAADRLASARQRPTGQAASAS